MICILYVIDKKEIINAYSRDNNYIALNVVQTSLFGLDWLVRNMILIILLLRMQNKGNKYRKKKRQTDQTDVDQRRQRTRDRMSDQTNFYSNYRWAWSFRECYTLDSTL